MADKQPAPQEVQTQPGSIWEAQEALLKLVEPEEETPETEEAAPTEEEESTEETQDESLEEESEDESEESYEDEEEESEETDERAVEGEDLLYAVNINGEEHQIPLDELLKGYSRQSDYTRKTQELSEHRKELDAYQNQWNAEVQQIQAERQQYVNALQHVIENSMGSLDQFATIDWEALKNDNPLEYITKRDEFREAQDKVRQSQYQQQQTQQLQQQEVARTHQTVLHEEHGKLVEALPEWSEPQSRQKLSTDIKAYALSQGYTQEEIGSLIDHRSLMTLYKAMKFDKASSPDIVNKKVKNKPKVIRAGSVRTKSEAGKQQRNAKMKRLRSSGHVDDAASILEDLYNS
jgi:hypothetical protein